MQLPVQYPYKPRPFMFLISFGSGVAWLGMQVVECNCIPYGFGLWFGLLPIVVGLLLLFQLLAANRSVSLDLVSITLPSGFLYLRATRIPYTTIERVWQTFLPYTGVMNIAASGKKYVILSTMLPDIASYKAIGDFLYEQSQERK